jgi:hypothetical protein
MTNNSQTADPGASAVKYTVPFTSAANAGLMLAAKAQRMEPTEIIQRATIKSLIADGHIKELEADRIKLFWQLVDRAVAEAQQLCRNGKFNPSITLDAIHVCMNDEGWIKGYRKYVQDDIYKNGNPAKGPINREIGFRIRAGIGGVTVKGADGKAATTKVLGEIIQSYTPMADYDRVTFGPKAI